MVCPNCNTNNVQGAQFCSVCGTTLPLAPPVAPVAPPAPPIYQAPVQPTYQAPVQPTYQAPPVMYDAYGQDMDRFNWAALTGMICGIASFLFCFINTWLALFVVVAGIVFSGLGLKSSKRGFAIAGLACSIVSGGILLLAIIGLFSSPYYWY